MNPVAPKLCPNCQKPNRPQAKFCKHCGTAWPVSVQDPLLGLVGLDTIRQALIKQRAVLQNLKADGFSRRLSFNSILIGGSGTAKSLIGRMMAQVFHQEKLTKKPVPIVMDGNSAVNLGPDDVKALFMNALDGVLFVDNAQRLVNAEGFPLPVFNSLVLHMDQFPNNPVVILAGLPYGFREFIQKPDNKNLTGRFQNVFIIPDYGIEQMRDLVVHNLRESHLAVSTDAEKKLLDRCRYLVKESQKPDSTLTAFNGYLAEIEAQSIMAEFYRRGSTDPTVEPQDIVGKTDPKKPIEAILAELDSVIGMDNIKAEIRSLYQQLNHQAKMAQQGVISKKIAKHYVITGNPGTGKTMIARLLGNIFEAVGLLQSGHVVEVDESKLIAGFIGQTAPNVNRYCDLALGGILFIDEAYSIAKPSSPGSGANFGQEAINALLKRMEDDRDKFMVIAAGYKRPMENFLTANEGLKNRFSKTFVLEDYTPAELKAIFGELIKKEGFSAKPEAMERVEAFFVERCNRKTKDFANGREARNLFDAARANQAERVAQEDSPDPSTYLIFEGSDIPGTTAEGAVSLDLALAELNQLIGLQTVKTAVTRLARSLKGRQLTGDTAVVSKHFVFTGNPGTGKTTVARIMAKVFQAIGWMPTDTLIEAKRKDLVAGTVGNTAPMVDKLCDAAMGGVLFIDEAYTLKQNDSDSAGQEAIDTLLTRLEDDRGKFVVIVAGYTKEMQDFISSNTGLKSRFTDFIDFEDYSPEEMKAIFLKLANDRRYVLEDGFADSLAKAMAGLYRNRLPGYANARTVRLAFDQTLENGANRVWNAAVPLDDQAAARELMVLRAIDLPMDRKKIVTVDEALKELNELVGLESVKTLVTKLVRTIQAQGISGETEPLSKHFVFLGSPGTGKTTVARIMAQVFQAAGLLPTDKLVEVDRGDLVAQYLGQTAVLVKKQCDHALGGVLFIDEAYSLARDSFGREAIDALLKRMEDDRGKFIVIAAGYTGEMNDFLDSNTGLRSRFTEYITFEDYTPQEMMAIFFKMATKKRIELEPGFEAALATRLGQLYAQRADGFANARTVRNLFEKSRENLSNRVLSLPSDQESQARDLRLMTVADLDQTIRG